MIDARFFIALYKSNNDMDIIPISLFREYDQKPLIVYHTKKEVIIELYCDECKEYNKSSLTLKSLKRPGGHRLYCYECGRELAYLGSKADVEAMVSRHQHEVELLMHEMGFDDYFTDPFIMYELINHIHDMAENKKISCQCGSRNVAANIGADKIELICKNCGSVYIVNAANQEDLEMVRKMQSITIKSKFRRKLTKY